MIKVERYPDLNLVTKATLNNYINNEFGNIPIVKETEWATPDWSIIKYKSNQILTFYNLVLREIDIDGKKYKVGGINNVITPKEMRGNGYSTNLLKNTEYLLFEEFNCDYGVLFCANELIPFYERLKWFKIDSVVYIEQSNGKKVWNSNTMLLSQNDKIQPKTIDLNGLPW